MCGMMCHVYGQALYACHLDGNHRQMQVRGHGHFAASSRQKTRPPPSPSSSLRRCQSLLTTAMPKKLTPEEWAAKRLLP
eukprot:IDg5292t1